MDWSFPSGHTAFVTAVVVAFIIALRNHPAGTWAPRLAVPLVLAIACTVLIIGVHYPTDVLASVLWASTVAPVGWAVGLRLLQLPAFSRIPGMRPTGTLAIPTSVGDTARFLEQSSAHPAEQSNAHPAEQPNVRPAEQTRETTA